MNNNMEVHGEAAVRFAAERLQRVSVDNATWEVHYIDERTGNEWVMDYPESGMHGGGEPRLRKRLPER